MLGEQRKRQILRFNELKIKQLSRKLILKKSILTKKNRKKSIKISFYRKKSIKINKI